MSELSSAWRRHPSTARARAMGRRALVLSTVVAVTVGLLAPSAGADPVPPVGPVVGPGGVGGELVLWLRADEGVAHTSGTVTAWTDQSAAAATATGVNGPTLAEAGWNYNPVIDFARGDAEHLTVPAGYADFTGGLSSAAVYRPTGTAGDWERIYDLGTGEAADNVFGGRSGLTDDLMFETRTPTLGQSTVTNGFTADTNHLFTFVQPGGTPGDVVVPEARLLGATAAGDDIAVPSNVTRTSNYIGRSNWAADAYYNGAIGEVILFNDDLTTGERARVEAYLAAKYGLTLDQSSPQDYLASDGTTLMWDADATYNHDVTIIGRDDASALYQLQSRAQTGSGLLTVALGSSVAASNAANSADFADDLDFLALADDGGAVGAWTAAGARSAVEHRLARAWQVQETGTVGPVTLQVPDAASSAPVKLPAALGGVFLLVDADGDFTSGATAVPVNHTANNWWVTTDLTDGQYVTFATDVDLDNDGVIDDTDPDDDSDGILDVDEATTDIDGDGLNARRDIDTDNDGITDNVEAQSTDGYIAPTGTDTDGDGLDDAYEPAGLTPVDSDNDSSPDVVDTDSDNDTIFDAAERGDGGPTSVTDSTDTDWDGLVDVFEHGTPSDGFDVNDGNVDGNGVWNLADGDNDTAADGTGAVPLTADLDYRDTDPATLTAPLVSAPVDGAHVAATTPTFSGTGSVGLTVTVKEGGTTLCTAVVDGAGQWTCTPGSALASGAHTVDVTQGDGVSTSGATQLGLVIDTTAPTAPTVTEPIVGSTVGGTGEPGTTVTVRDGDGGVLCTATVPAGGTWTCPLNRPLADNEPLTVSLTDAAGNTQSTSVSSAPDLDRDGVPDATDTDDDGDGTADATEALAGSGDGNGDGIPDSRQADVATVTNPVTGVPATFAVTSTASCRMTQAQVLSGTGLATDTGYSRPAGLFDFDLSCGTAGATVTMKIYLGARFDTTGWVARKLTGSTYRTYNATFATETVNGLARTVMTVTLTDGGSGDDDGVANGVIVDPIAPAVAANTTTTSGSGGTGSGGTGSGGTTTLAHTGGDPLPVVILGTTLIAVGGYLQRRPRRRPALVRVSSRVSPRFSSRRR